MSKNSPIGDGQVVQIHYTLQDPDGEVIDTSRGDEPLAYLHGGQNIVPGLERQIAGRAVGDKFVAEVSPEEGYGLSSERPPQRVERDAFPPHIPLEEGMQLMAEGDDGDLTPIWILEVDGDDVVISMDHPLAGVPLTFDIEIVATRAASAEEMAHGHPHGPGGHHH